MESTNTCLIVKDPHVNESHKKEFVDLLEAYFLKRGEKFYKRR